MHKLPSLFGMPMFHLRSDKVTLSTDVSMQHLAMCLMMLALQVFGHKSKNGS